MRMLTEHVEFGRETHDDEVRNRAFAQQSPAQWDEAKRLCFRVMEIVFQHETGQISATAANIQLSELSQRSEPETRALANHLAEGLSAYFFHAKYWE